MGSFVGELQHGLLCLGDPWPALIGCKGPPSFVAWVCQGDGWSEGGEELPDILLGIFSMGK